MTIGQKLAGYRKLSGMTQQQLGDYLNISAQAISKWEKDLSEPALATLHELAKLYKVSVDELLDPKSGFPDMESLTDKSEEKENNSTATPNAIGFCKKCGITVTEENVGATQPIVVCAKCKALEEKQKKEAEAKEKRAREEEARLKAAQLEANRRDRRNHRTLSFSFAGLGAAAFLVLMIIVMVKGFKGVYIPLTLIGIYVVFSFISSLFYDCAVQEVVVDWFDKSLHLPGLIFDFDLDGIIWVISMKLLFWILGIIFGIVTGIIGITLGLIIAPFVFPYVMAQEKRGIAKGERLIK